MVLGLPVGVSFMGTAFSEPALITLASGFEHVMRAPRLPQFFDGLPVNGEGAFVKGRRPNHSQRPPLL